MKDWLVESADARKVLVKKSLMRGRAEVRRD
jgi:hypothetical protein